MYYDESFTELTLQKQIVSDVLEPFIIPITVSDSKNRFSINFMKFGTFEIGEREYIYGTSFEEYMHVFNDANSTHYPLSFALKTKKGYVLAPTLDFSEEEYGDIKDSIQYYFDSQQAMSHYMAARC